MSSAIQFLERMGCGAPVFDVSEGGYFQAVHDLDVPDELRQALLDGDARLLGELVGGRKVMMMQIWAPQEDVPQKDDRPVREAPGEEEGDEPERGS